MRRNSALALLSALLVLLLCACGQDGEGAGGRSVALIVKSTGSEFFLSVFAGAQAAATEYNLELTIAGPETEEDYEAQNRMIAQAVEGEAESIAQVTEGIGQISSVVQTNSASSEESAAVSAELFDQVRLLQDQTRRFQLKN